MDIPFKLEDPQSPLGEGEEGLPFRSYGNVIILSKEFIPSKAQLNLLNRGLTFIPSLDVHKNLKLELLHDLQEYHRRLKLATYYKDTDTNIKTHFIPKSLWSPPADKIPEEVHNLIKKDLDHFKQHSKIRTEEPNLPMLEVKALRELIHNKSIVIKPADKGSAVVVLSREQYTQEALRQLKDNVHYKQLDKPIYPETMKLIKNITKKMLDKKFINKKQKQYLDGDGNVRERRFYMLPKIHKDPEKWHPPFTNPPGRPIVSDCSSESYQTAEFLEHFLHPVSIKHASYIKDTYHFIQIIKNLKIPLNSTFFSMDVDSLYTNIDTPSGIQAVKNIFFKYPDKKRPEKELIELLEINLTRNDFLFDDKFYLQTKGTAMGKKFAPSYANIFMAQWEEEALARCPKQPLHYFRFLDDIFGIWTHSKEDFLQFVTILNSHDPSIKLKYVFDESSMDFLDTTVYKSSSFQQDGKLETKVYFKKTDTHALLYKTSFHPRHTYRGIVKSQLLRFHRICSNIQDFRKAVQTLFTSLRRRGYSRTFLRHCLKNFLTRNIKDNKQIIPLITRYSSCTSIINRKFKKNFYESNLTNLIPNHKIIVAYRKNKNLQDFLVQAKLPKLLEKNKRPKLDNFSNFQYIRNQKTKSLFYISSKFSPRTSNCVYIIICSKCKKQYVGETKNSIATRMWQHKYNILNYKELDTPLVFHFIKHGLSALQVGGLQHDPSWSTSDRKKAERRWIYLLNSTEPIGLNKKWMS